MKGKNYQEETYFLGKAQDTQNLIYIKRYLG